MKLSLLLLCFALAATTFASGECAAVASYGDIRLTGPIGNRLEQMIENHLLKTDVRTLSSVFHDKTERNRLWQTEFWGKFMHAAVPLWIYSGSATLKEKIDSGVESVLSSQEADGYIGNYPAELRCGEGWDVWGMKYTMMGLLHYYDGLCAGDENGREKAGRALAAAQRVCDYLIARLGPDGTAGRRLYQSGNWSGLASSSVLEPILWLYRRTDEKRDLKFAESIVRDMTEAPDGPRLLDLALKGVSVADRNGYGGIKSDERGNYVTKHSRSKAYEMMSCYQGLLEYYEITGRKDVLKATIATVEQILSDEVFVTGGSTSAERWCHGSGCQHLPYMKQQETCVVTTWMRLLEKLLTITGDARYAEELERAFYNAYLASLNRDASEFAAYTPINGYRSRGHHHCWMHTNCCNANGPRGFLTFLRAMLQARDETATFNLYASGTARIALPGSGRLVSFETYTLYPRKGSVRIVNRTPGTQTFTVAFRVPSWSSKTSVRLNGQAQDIKPETGYVRLNRDWSAGDVVELGFDMTVLVHRLDHAVAFSRGPIVLARDTRFGDGLIDEPLHLPWLGNSPEIAITSFMPARSPSEEFDQVVVASLPIRQHDENPEGRVNPLVRFCDYASAANRWEPENGCRVWLPVERAPWK